MYNKIIEIHIKNLKIIFLEWFYPAKYFLNLLDKYFHIREKERCYIPLFFYVTKWNKNIRGRVLIWRVG